MKFSVCIPNYNYARYLREAIESALNQEGCDLEVLVRDNRSTDGSVEVVRSIPDPRIRIDVNRCNVGFAGNLDKVAEMACGDWLVVLSSDDVMSPGALATVRTVVEHLGPTGQSAIIGAANDLIDANSRSIGSLIPDPRMWRASDRDSVLEAVMGCPVYRVAAGELLGRCVRIMANPYFLSASFYPRSLYEAVEGFGGGRLMNPDRWFHWRVLDVATDALFIDKPLAASRWHDANQTAQQAAAGALKYMVDEYVSTFQLTTETLGRIGMTRSDVERAFVECDIGRHGLATLGEGHRAKAQRILHFGKATYPQHMRRNSKVFALRALLAGGPVGAWLAGIGLRWSRKRRIVERDEA